MRPQHQTRLDDPRDFRIVEWRNDSDPIADFPQSLPADRAPCCQCNDPSGGGVSVCFHKSPAGATGRISRTMSAHFFRAEATEATEATA